MSYDLNARVELCVWSESWIEGSSSIIDLAIQRGYGVIGFVHGRNAYGVESLFDTIKLAKMYQNRIKVLYGMKLCIELEVDLGDFTDLGQCDVICYAKNVHGIHILRKLALLQQRDCVVSERDFLSHADDLLIGVQHSSINHFAPDATYLPRCDFCLFHPSVEGVSGFASQLIEKHKSLICATSAEEIESDEFNTTNEMLAQMPYIIPEKAYEFVVTNPQKIADMCEHITDLPDESED